MELQKLSVLLTGMLCSVCRADVVVVHLRKQVDEAGFFEGVQPHNPITIWPAGTRGERVSHNHARECFSGRSFLWTLSAASAYSLARVVRDGVAARRRCRRRLLQLVTARGADETDGGGGDSVGNFRKRRDCMKVEK